MSKTDVGAGLGVAALIAICCAGPVLLLLGLPLLAALADQATLIAGAAALALAVVGVVVWRRRGREYTLHFCTPSVGSRASPEAPAVPNGVVPGPTPAIAGSAERRA